MNNNPIIVYLKNHLNVLKKLFIVLILSFSFYSCEKEKIEPGIIVQNIDFGTCIPADLPEQEYIITSDSVYQLLLNNSVCSNYTLPTIDFSQYTLLGKFASGKCRVTFKPQVIKDESNMQYLFTVYVFDKGICKKEGISMNWVLVPKLPIGWSVNFKTE